MHLRTIAIFAGLGGLLAAATIPVVLGSTACADHPSSGQASRDREVVPKEFIRFDDGDTLDIHWPDRVETVRILGIDTPEVLHLDHNLPFPQPFGEKAAGFLQGCLAVANRVTLARAAEPDPFGRTLGYVFLDGKNYSALVLQAGLAAESITHYGDNGFPQLAAECLAAAKLAGPLPFEPPHQYRRRMRELSEWMKKQGTYPLDEDG